MVQLICSKEAAKKNILKYFMGNYMAKYFVKFIRLIHDIFVSNTLHISSIIHVVVIKTSVHRILN